MFPFDPPWKHQKNKSFLMKTKSFLMKTKSFLMKTKSFLMKTKSFLMFSGGSKGNIGKKKVKHQRSLWQKKSSIKLKDILSDN